MDQNEEQIELPPGFRFHPTDEELITHYLSPKVLNNVFCAVAIGEVDLNKCEPWDLPGRAKMGEKEWYFFCVRDRKYPTGLRTNRATEAGYWKATGKDKEIYRGKTLIGMKKTLVFYRGRAPKGEKSSWVMHEYRLEGKISGFNLPKPAKNEWVICRVFKKSSGQKKANINGFELNSSSSSSLHLPPLTDSSSSLKLSHVTCFSTPMEVMNSNPSEILSLPLPLPRSSASNSFYPPQISLSQNPDFSQPPNSYFFKMLLENHLPHLKQFSKAEFSPDAGLSTDISSGISNHDIGHDDPSTEPVDLDCLWNY